MSTHEGAERMPRRGTPAYESAVWKLAATGADGVLLDMALELTKTQDHLSTLMGLSGESISRVKNGHRRHGFAPESRNWLASYLINPSSPPPKLEGGAGQRPRAGAQAPQVQVKPSVATAFAGLTAKHGQRAVFEWCVRRYLAQYPAGTEIPAPPPPPRGEAGVVRAYRAEEALLTAFEARVGGPLQRGGHFRAALEQGIRALRGQVTLPPIGAAAPPPRRRPSTVAPPAPPAKVSKPRARRDAAA